MSEFHSLASLIKRLEVATTRLEDLAMSASSASAVAASSSNNHAAAAPPPLQPPPQGAQEESVSVQKFDEAIQPLLQKFVAISNEMGGAVANQVRYCYCIIRVQPLINPWRYDSHRLRLSTRRSMRKRRLLRCRARPRNPTWARRRS